MFIDINVNDDTFILFCSVKFRLGLNRCKYPCLKSFKAKWTQNIKETEYIRHIQIKEFLLSILKFTYTYLLL